MNLLIVNYDLGDSSYEEAVLGYIGKRSESGMLCESCYLIYTKKAPGEVKDDLKRITNETIKRCFISPAVKPYSWRGISADAQQMLKDHLP